MENVRIPKDKDTGRQRAYGFVEFTHEVSVPYACQLLDGTPLFQRSLKVNPSGSGNSSSSGNQSPGWSPKLPNQNWEFKGQITPVRREGHHGGQSGPNLMYHGNTPDFHGALQRSHSFPGNLQEKLSPWQQGQQYVTRFSPNSFSPCPTGSHSPLHFQAMNNMQQGRLAFSPFMNQGTPPGRGNWRR